MNKNNTFFKIKTGSQSPCPSSASFSYYSVSSPSKLANSCCTQERCCLPGSPWVWIFFYSPRLVAGSFSVPFSMSGKCDQF